MGHGINRQRHIALHMHGDIALNGCECMINESTLHWYLIWGGGGLDLMGQRPTELHGFIHENETMCRVSVRRNKSPLG